MLNLYVIKARLTNEQRAYEKLMLWRFGPRYIVSAMPMWWWQ